MNIKSFFSNPCNVYFSIWCLYLLQGTLYPSASILSRLLVIIIIIISAKHAVEVGSSRKKPIYFVGLGLLVLMYFVYGTIYMVSKGQFLYLYLKNYMMSLLPIFSCFLYAKKGFLNKKMLQRWVVFFVVVAIAEYYRLQREMVEAMIINPDEDFTNNMGYVLLSLIPCMVVYDEKPWMQYIGLGICTFFVLMGMKRGAILIGVVALVMFIWYKMKNSKGIQKLFVILIVAVSMFYLSYLVQDLLENSDYFYERVSQTKEGDTSNRDIIYKSLLNSYRHDSSTTQKLFGRGANGTISLRGHYAHQDWLETLINQGLLGVVFFMIYWYLFYKTSRNNRYSKQSRFVLFLIFVLFGLKTMFSMSIGDMTIYVSAILGYSLADGFAKDDIRSNSNSILV